MVVFKLKYFTLTILLLLFWVENGISKPKPPPELLSVIAEFSEMEERFESGEWKEAAESLGEIEEVIGDIESDHPELLKRFDFKPIIGRLKMAIDNKDFKTTTDAYIALQKQLFLLSDSFDYTIPPSIQIMGKYINQDTVKALEEKNYEEVYNEMREVGTFFRISKQSLKDKGATDASLQAFNNNLIQVIKETKKEDKSMVPRHFDELRKLFDGFLALYPDQAPQQ